MSERGRSFPSSAARAAVVVLALVAVGLAFVLPPSGGEAKGATQFLGRFHVLALHLPIGALVLATLVEGVVVLRGERVRTRADAALDALVPFLFATASVALVLGVLLAYGGGHPAHALALHRGTTLASLVACAGAGLAWTKARSPEAGLKSGARLAFRAGLGLTAALMSAGAHFGGSLTHGDDYLVQFAPEGLRGVLGGGHATAEGSAKKAEGAPPDAGAGADPRVFTDVLAPLLREHCAECHGADKQKGRLRLDSLEALRAGGKHGPAMVAKDGAKSLVVVRMRLPASDDERMPPADQKKVPPPEMVELLALWIDRGADPELRVRDLLVPEGPRRLLERSAGSAPAAPAPAPAAPAPAPAPAPANSDAIANAAAPAGTVPVFAARIRPVLDARCGSCHARGKSKGGLRTDSFSALVTGGDGGPAIVPGSPSKGSLLARLRLPLDAKEHMPPRAHPQLSPGELALLSWWVAHGAPETAASAPPAFASGPAAPAPAPASTPAPADAKANAATRAVLARLSAGELPRGATLFREIVAPILEGRCSACHAGSDPSSGARFDDPKLLLAKGHVVPGKPEASPLLARVRLPASDADHMPPTDSPQLTRAEVDALGAWISGGAQIEEPAASAAPTATEPAALTAPAKAAANVQVPPRAGGCGACTAAGAPGDGLGAALAGVAIAVALGARSRRRS